MKRILFPTAYSEHSKVAFRYAQKLASYFEAGITILHVYPNPFPVLMEEDYLSAIEINTSDAQKVATENKELARLKAFTEERFAKQFTDISLDYRVAAGNVAEEIIRIQRHHDYDMVIMGMRRHSRIEKMLGTTAYSLINNLACNILLVPPHASFLGMDRIVYGTALEIEEIKSIEYLLDWCLAFNASLSVFHAHAPELKKQAADKMSALITVFKEAVEHQVVDFKLQEGKTSALIEEYLKTTDADLLVLHPHKKEFWQRLLEGSMTRTLAEKLDIPLLVLNT